MPLDYYQPIGIALLLLAGAVALGLLGILSIYRRRRQLARPDWQRMMAETPYFRQSMQRLFKVQGYEIIQWWEFRDPIEREVREVVFALRRRGQVYAALCGRWVIPITSEVITRFEQALATTQARAGLIVTTSFFSDAALARARTLPVELHDGTRLQEWIENIWA